MNELNQFLSEQEILIAKAKLKIAKHMGTIDTDEWEAVKIRCEKKNQEVKKNMENGEIVYGVRSYSLLTYLQYELTRVKLDYISYKGEYIGEFKRKIFTEDDENKFYSENLFLFTEANGEICDIDEENLRPVIRKKLREREYEELVTERAICILRKKESFPKRSEKNSGTVKI